MMLEDEIPWFQEILLL